MFEAFHIKQKKNSRSQSGLAYTHEKSKENTFQVNIIGAVLDTELLYSSHIVGASKKELNIFLDLYQFQNPRPKTKQ